MARSSAVTGWPSRSPATRQADPQPLSSPRRPVDFGDGTIGTMTGACANRVPVAHAYRQGGDYEPKVTQVSVCDLNFAADLSGTIGRVHVFPAAPPASARWPA